MLGYIQGKLLDRATPGRFLVTVGASEQTVGYLISVPQSARYLEPTRGSLVELFLHTHVREDILDLYGFLSPEEKELFLTLVTVNGIGPKAALGLMSSVEPARLIQAILERDQKFLKGLPGIGKKTAERVCLELAEPLQKKLDEGKLSQLYPAGVVPLPAQKFALLEKPLLRDAALALEGLGYRRAEVEQMLAAFGPDGGRFQRVEDLLREVLQGGGPRA